MITMMMSIIPSDMALSPKAAGGWKSAAPPLEQSISRPLVPAPEPGCVYFGWSFSAAELMQ